MPIELVFNEGPNELFVVRVAGNSLGTDVLGSFHYAISHLRKSLRLLVVLGHSGCGALTAAVDAFLDPGGYLEIATNEQLRSIVDRHLIAVQASARALARAYGSDVMVDQGTGRLSSRRRSRQMRLWRRIRCRQNYMAEVSGG